ncbi:hypothetical protein BH09SUM1_BH09SUM1_19590 [soil metagenome]
MGKTELTARQMKVLAWALSAFTVMLLVSVFVFSPHIDPMRVYLKDGELSRMGVAASAIGRYQVDHGEFPPATAKGTVPADLSKIDGRPVYTDDGSRTAYVRRIPIPRRIGDSFNWYFVVIFLGIVLITAIRALRSFNPEAHRERRIVIVSFILISAFYIGGNTLIHILTTDEEYVSEGYGSKNKSDYSYAANEAHAIIQSVGPDGKRDFTDLDKLLHDPTASGEKPGELQIVMTYDPTNGAGGTGDLFRVVDRRPER